MADPRDIRVRRLVREVRDGALVLATGRTTDQRTFVGIVIRLCGIPEFPSGQVPGTEVECDRILSTIHKAFSAPGNWGYDTRLGRALRRLYEEGGR